MPKVDLPSPPVSLQPNTPRIEVGPGGKIDPKRAPARFFISQKFSEIVVWVVMNKSGQPITVTIVDFLRKKDMFEKKGTEQLPTCLQWLTGASVQVESGQVGFLAGFVDPHYQMKGLLDHVSYTIQVRSRAGTNPFPDFDYDPDGDIKP